MRYRALSLLIAVGCGQSADTIGPRNNLPPPVEDTGWKTDFEACATVREEASPIPTNLFLAVDRSCSMADPADGSTRATPSTVSKWDAATAAFSAFFTDTASASLGAALRLWPDATDGCDHLVCDAVACSQPQVPLGSVGDPVHQQDLIDALTTALPEGATPMHAALDGAVQWSTDLLASAPDEQVAIVFVTDGEPNGCDEAIANIAALAADASAAGVPVFTVGIEGSNVAQIDQIAQAGGTSAGYFVGSANAEADLLAALQDIQAQTVSCRFTFPTQSTGDPLSPDLVRLEYESGGETVLVARVADETKCDANDGGYYLDDPADPSTITLCPSTCSEVQDIETIAIEVDVGCECVTDADCPGDTVCSEDGCVPPCEDCYEADGSEVTGPMAVQGGALNCATVPGPAGLWVLLAGMLAVRTRREAS